MEEIISIIENTKSNIFVHGIGGTGKTYIAKQIYKKYPNVVLTSTTGISALNLGGITIHSFSGLGYFSGTAKENFDKMNKRYLHDKRIVLKTVDILIIDEISMLSGKNLDLLNNFFKLLFKTNKAFGGMRIIFTGDVLQLPPVEEESENMTDYFFKSNTWKTMDLKIINLNIPYRYENKEWFERLKRVRLGKITKSDHLFFTEKEVSDEIDETITPFIYPLKRQVNRFNNKKLKQLETDLQTFQSIDVVMFEDEMVRYKKLTPDNKILSMRKYKLLKIDNKLDKLIGKEIKIKKGARVMLKLNINPMLVNGLQGNVLEIENDKIIIEFDNIGKIEIIKEPFYYVFKGVYYVRFQYPFILSWACTIHCVQGLSLDSASLYIGTSIFENSQAYVALSRLKSSDKLQLLDYDPVSIKKVNKIALKYDEYISNIKG